MGDEANNASGAALVGKDPLTDRILLTEGDSVDKAKSLLEEAKKKDIEEEKKLQELILSKSKKNSPFKRLCKHNSPCALALASTFFSAV